MLEAPLSANITGNSLTVANQLVFVSGEPFEAHRSTCMEFARADAQFRTEAVTETVGEACRSVVEDARSVNLLHKMGGHAAILSDNGFCVTGAVVVDVFDSFVGIVHNLYRKYQVGVFRVPVILARLISA